MTSPIVNRVRFNRWFYPKRNESLEQLELQQKLQQTTPVFVYQMGKVASTSIYRSLQGSYHGAVLHSHSFGPYHPSPSIRALHEHFQQRCPAIKLISLVREPVSRNISAFFQNFKRDTGIPIERCQLSSEQLKQRFLYNYPHEIPWVWFDTNIKKHFGIDVYDYPFPSQGFQRIQKGPVELLIMRHDLQNDQKESIIREYLEMDSFSLSNQNVGAEKKYSDLYHEFKRLKLPLWYLHRLASTQYMKHFFYDDIGPIIRNWQENTEAQQQAG